MDYTHLGRSGVRVSRLCLGTMNFGPQAGEKESHAILDAAVAAGINFVDTANTYGNRRGEGITEQIVGRWLAQGGGRRDRIVLATKVYGRMHDWPNGDRLSALAVVRECEASLRRLQTDHVDLYQMHHVDRETPWEEIWQAMELLVQQGKVVYVGSSNFAGWHIAAASEAARARHFLGLVSEQSLYNLAQRSVELEVLPACRAYGLGVLPWSPLFGGVLAGMLRRQPTGGRRVSEMARARLSRVRESVQEYEDLCASIGVEPASVALAWLLRQDGVTAPVIGPRDVAQLAGNLGALSVTLDDETLARLDGIFPGPGAPAPEAYAW